MVAIAFLYDRFLKSEDRRLFLADLGAALDKKLAETARVQYFNDASHAEDALADIAGRERYSFYAIGSKSTAASYLKKVAEKACAGAMDYHRLLTGDHITDDLHQHLRSVIGKENVFIHWHPSEKWGNVAIAEEEVLWTLPTPKANEFTGFKVYGRHHHELHRQYFNQAIDDNETIEIWNERGIEILCEKHGYPFARHADQIRDILKKELARLTMSH